MNWDALGAIGEIIGAVAVVATLGYLAIQIRHSVDLAEAEAFKSSTQDFMSTQSALLEPGKAELFIRGKEDYGSLDPVERLHFQVLMSNLLYEMEIVLEQHRTGFVTDELLVPYNYYYKALVLKPGVREYLKHNRNLHGPTFQKWLNEQYG